MKTLSLLLGALLLCYAPQRLFAQQDSPSFGDLSFFRIAEGKGDAGLLDLHEDPQGNLLAVGFFAESLQFGSQSFTCNAPRTVKYFYAKFSSEGQLLWLREHPAVGEGLRITTEKIECDAQGNLYVFGLYRGNARFGNGQGQSLQNNTQNAQEYLAKYNGSGQLLWVRGFNNGFYDGERDLVTDAQGNSYLLGYPAALRKINSEGDELYYTPFPAGFTAGSLCLWQNKVFVGASLRGENEFSLQLAGQESLRLPAIKAAQGYFYNQDAFLARLNANSGQIEWLQLIRSNITDEIEGLAVDNEGNVSIAGTCAGNATLGLSRPSGFLPASEQNRKTVPFVASFTSEGRLRWVRGLRAEDKGQDEGHYAVSLSVNKNTGQLLGTRAHCNERLWWAVYMEGFDKNGRNTFYKALGLGANKTNTGFWKSSCGVANVFVHRSNYQNNVYVYGEGRYIDAKDFGAASGSRFASLAHSGNNTRFFISGYRATGAPSPQPTIPTEPPLGNGTVSFKGCATGQEQVAAENEQFEREVLRIVNAERQKQGLPALRWSADLARAARYHAADMHTDKYFEHDSYDRKNGNLVQVCHTFERIEKFGQGFGENIAINPGSPEDVMESWMNSPGHRNNILGKHQSLGVGFHKGYWVQVFGQ